MIYTNSVAISDTRSTAGLFPAPVDRRPQWSDDGGPAARLLAMIDEGRAWWADAACRGAGTVHFFPEGEGGDTGKTVAAARAKWCNRCTVADTCREVGEYERGVWAGTSERERMRARRDASGITCGECGHPCATLAVLRKHIARFHKEAAA